MKRKRHQHSRLKKKTFQTATELTEAQIQQAGMLARENDKPIKERGLFARYAIRRLDGSTNKGGKHNKCDYFVLDITHDPHAVPAIFSYARSAEADGYKQLAADLYGKIQPFIQKLNEQAEAEAHESILIDMATDVAADMTDAELSEMVSKHLWVTFEPGSQEEQILSEYMKRFDAAKAKPVRRSKKTSDPIAEKIKKVVKDAAKNIKPKP